jgi:tetratricopeptide (TPR) repeat protein
LPQEELKAYARALRADPWLAPAHYDLGRLFIDQGKPVQALHQYEILKSIDDTLAQRLFDAIYPGTNADTADPDRE